MYFLKIKQNFLTYYLLEAILNGCIREHSFLQLIYSLLLITRQFYYITIDLTVKLNDQEIANRSCL